MSTKITDARMKELEQLTKLKDDLKEKIRAHKAEMQRLRDTMDAEARESISSSSRAAKKRRGKDQSSLNHQEVVDSLDITIARLEEHYNNVDNELEGLKGLME